MSEVGREEEDEEVGGGDDDCDGMGQGMEVEDGGGGNEEGDGEDEDEGGEERGGVGGELERKRIWVAPLGSVPCVCATSKEHDGHPHRVVGVRITWVGAKERGGREGRGGGGSAGGASKRMP